MSAVTRYAIASTNWSSTATWSATSGGSGGASVPTTGDTADLNGNAVVLDVAAIAPALITDTSAGGAGTLIPAAPGNYTVGTTGNPTLVKSVATAAAGHLQTVDGVDMILNGRVWNAATAEGATSLAALVSATAASSTLTINAPAGQKAIQNDQPAAAVETGCFGIYISGGSVIETIFAKLVVNGDTLNTGIKSAAIYNSGSRCVVNGNSVNGVNGNGAIAAGGSAILQDTLSNPNVVVSTTTVGNVTNYANGGYPWRCGINATTAGNQCDIGGNWENYDPSVSPGSAGVGQPVPLNEALLIIRGDVDALAGQRAWAITTPVGYAGVLIVLGKFLQDVYWTGVVLMCRADAFTKAVLNSNGVWICIGTPDMASLKAGGNPWRYVVSAPGVTIYNPAAQYSDTPLVSAGGLTAQDVRDAMLLAPSAGTPAAGSVDWQQNLLIASAAGKSAVNTTAHTVDIYDQAGTTSLATLTYDPAVPGKITNAVIH